MTERLRPLRWRRPGQVGWLDVFQRSEKIEKITVIEKFED
jgi:hypothetical protein